MQRSFPFVVACVGLGLACGSGVTPPQDSTSPDSDAAAASTDGGPGALDPADARRDPPATGEGAASCDNACAAYTTGPSSTVVDSKLVELSGLAASRESAGVLYAHNDSGGDPTVFAIGPAGQKLGRFELANATAIDWEDMAVGPCGGETCVYVGDIGDNDAERSDYAIYRAPEPVVSVDMPAGTKEITAQRFGFSYPDGSHNAESLLVHPASGNVYVITKVETGASAVYALTAPLSDGMMATKVTDLVVPAGGLREATSAAFHPCGDRFLLRTYDRLFEYVAPAGGAEAAVFGALPQALGVADEPQGEAVTYGLDGRSIITSSEGKSPTLHVLACP